MNDNIKSFLTECFNDSSFALKKRNVLFRLRDIVVEELNSLIYSLNEEEHEDNIDSLVEALLETYEFLNEYADNLETDFVIIDCEDWLDNENETEDLE